MKFLHLKSKLHLPKKIERAQDALVMRSRDKVICLKRFLVYVLTEIVFNHIEAMEQRFQNLVPVWSQISQHKT